MSSTVSPGQKDGEMIKVSREAIGLVRTKTESGIPVKEVYGPEDIADLNYNQELGNPGEYPYTRGIYPRMYRKQLWLRTASIGYGTPEETNRAIKKYVAAGLTGPRIICDTPTLVGIDPDHPMAKYGLAANGHTHFALTEYEISLDGISLDGLDLESAVDTQSASFNYYIFMVALAEHRGFDIRKLRGNIINDLTYSQLNVYNRDFPSALARKIAMDLVEFSTKYTHGFYSFVPSGYGISEGGADAIQELGIIVATAKQYLEDARERGINLEEMRPVAFSLCGKMDFFETIAKCRAVRRIWAKIMKDHFRINSPRLMAGRIGIETAGSTSQYEKPINNISRITIEMLACVLGGAQSVNPTQIAEQHGLASDESRVWDQDVHHIITHETNIPLTADPLGGSYYVEWLTSELEKGANKLIDEIDRRGGIWACLKSGWLGEQLIQGVIKREAEVQKGERIIVGTNMFQGESGPISQAIEQSAYKRPLDEARYKVIQRFKEFKERRNEDKTGRALAELYKVANEGKNVVRPAIEAAKAEATVGELVGVLRMASGYPYDSFEMVTEPDFIRRWIKK